MEVEDGTVRKPSLDDRLGGVHTPDKFAVTAEEQAELKAIVKSTRSDIVDASAIGVGHVA